MKYKSIMFLPIFASCLVSCGSNRHDISEYILKTPYKDNYRILQLTDVHLGDKDKLEEHFKFMDITIKEANPDLIVVTGDLFTFASKSTAKSLFDFLDSYDSKWTVCFGNHDEQCYFSIDWMTNTLNNYGDKCLFKDIQDDDIFGNCNFAINLMQGESVFEQIIVMDSNRYQFGLESMGYDCFKVDQIDWYSRLVDTTKANNGGTTVESLMFYHIPLPEVDDAWESGKDDPSKIKNPTGSVAQKNEKSCPPKKDNHFFDIIKAKGSTKGMYFGHDHVNNFIVEYEGVDFGYGIKSTNRVYYQEDMMGGRVIVIKNDHTLEYEDYYHTYKEIEK